MLSMKIMLLILTVLANSDRFVGNMKNFIVCCYSVAALSFLWFALQLSGAMHSTTTTLYVACILGCLSINATIPLFYELIVETT